MGCTMAPICAVKFAFHENRGWRKEEGEGQDAVSLCTQTQEMRSCLRIHGLHVVQTHSVSHVLTNAGTGIKPKRVFIFDAGYGARSLKRD